MCSQCHSTSPTIRTHLFYLTNLSKTKLTRLCSLPKADSLYIYPEGTEHHARVLVLGSSTILVSIY